MYYNFAEMIKMLRVVRIMKIEAKKGAQLQFDLFKEEAFVDDHDLHPTAKDAALSIQCDPPAEFEGSGLTKLKCASSKCDLCPAFKRPTFELSVDDDSDTVIFLCFETKLTCSRCGVDFLCSFVPEA